MKKTINILNVKFIPTFYINENPGKKQPSLIRLLSGICFKIGNFSQTKLNIR